MVQLIPRDPVTLKVREMDLPDRLQAGTVLSVSDLGIKAAALNAAGQVVDGSGNPVTGGSGGGVSGVNTPFEIKCPGDADLPRPTVPAGVSRVIWLKETQPSNAIEGDEWASVIVL